jgi:uncharacterized protein YqgC (DUF456 family)
MELATIGLWTLAALLVAGGLAGLVLPALPGAPLLFAGILLAAWIEGFAYLGVWSLSAIGALAVLAIAVDFIAGALGAQRYGASGRAVLGATIGAVVGLAFGLVGVLIGPFVGAVLGELTVRRDLGAAGLAGFGATVGLVLGTAAKLALGLAMIGVAVVVRFL